MKQIEKVEFDPPSDPLFRDAELAYDVELPVIGIPVRFESNSRQVIDAVIGSFGVWSSLKNHPELLASDSARVRLIAHEGEEGPEQHAEVRYRCPSPDRVLVATRGSFGVAEFGKGPDRLEAYAFVTPRLVADTAHFQYSFVEALTLVLLTGRDRHPIHAATLAREGAALLLVGPRSPARARCRTPLVSAESRYWGRTSPTYSCKKSSESGPCPAGYTFPPMRLVTFQS